VFLIIHYKAVGERSICFAEAARFITPPEGVAAHLPSAAFLIRRQVPVPPPQYVVVKEVASYLITKKSSQKYFHLPAIQEQHPYAVFCDSIQNRSCVLSAKTKVHHPIQKDGR
jgi:hypothetical protein